MDSEIGDDIIVEIIEKCMNDHTMMAASANFHSDNNVPIDEQLCDLPNAGEGDNGEIEEQNIHVENEETVLFDQFEALKADRQSALLNERSVDEISTNGENYDAQLRNVENELQVETSTEGGGESPSDVKPANEVVSIASKGYRKEVRAHSTLIVNSALMAEKSKFLEYEVMCHGFPPRMTEVALISLFEQFGQVYKLRKITDKNLTFVTYIEARDAERAIKSLHGTNIQGRTVELQKSLPKKHLIVRNIPLTATKTQLRSKFSYITSGLVSVQLYNDPLDETKNRGYCYLEYEDNGRAMVAMRILATSKIFKSPITVEWPERRYEWQETPRTLYISNLRGGISIRDLTNLFSVYGELADVTVIGNSAKIVFQRDEDVRRAALGIDRRLLGNENVDITFCKMIKQFEPYTERTDVLYIKNLSSTVSTPLLEKMFAVYGVVIKIQRNDGFASIRFQCKDEARIAMRYIDRSQLGENVKISYFKFPEFICERNVPQSFDTHNVPKPFETHNVPKPFDTHNVPQSFQAHNVPHSFDTDNVPKPFDTHNVPKPFDTLYVSNLSPKLTLSELRQQFSGYGKLKDVDKDGDSATVRYWNLDNGKHAARRINRQRLGDNVKISFTADDEESTEKKRAEQSDALYICNMYADMTAQRLRQIFSVYGRVLEVDKNNNSATVRFQDINDCQRAASQVDKSGLGESNVQISLSPKMR